MSVSNCCISRGSVATYLRCGGNYYTQFVGNFFLFTAVQEFFKSVKIWQSYRQSSGPQFFLGTQWRSCLQRIMSHTGPAGRLYNALSDYTCWIWLLVAYGTSIVSHSFIFYASTCTRVGLHTVLAHSIRRDSLANKFMVGCVSFSLQCNNKESWVHTIRYPSVCIVSYHTHCASLRDIGPHTVCLITCCEGRKVSDCQTVGVGLFTPRKDWGNCFWSLVSWVACCQHCLLWRVVKAVLSCLNVHWLVQSHEWPSFTALHTSVDSGDLNQAPPKQSAVCSTCIIPVLPVNCQFIWMACAFGMSATQPILEWL